MDVKKSSVECEEERERRYPIWKIIVSLRGKAGPPRIFLAIIRVSGIDSFARDAWSTTRRNEAEMRLGYELRTFIERFRERVCIDVVTLTFRDTLSEIINPNDRSRIRKVKFVTSTLGNY